MTVYYILLISPKLIEISPLFPSRSFKFPPIFPQIPHIFVWVASDFSKIFLNICYVWFCFVLLRLSLSLFHIFSQNLFHIFHFILLILFQIFSYMSLKLVLNFCQSSFKFFSCYKFSSNSVSGLLLNPPFSNISHISVISLKLSSHVTHTYVIRFVFSPNLLQISTLNSPKFFKILILILFSSWPNPNYTPSKKEKIKKAAA